MHRALCIIQVSFIANKLHTLISIFMMEDIILGWAVAKAADLIASKSENLLRSKLSRTDLQKAIGSGIKAAAAWEENADVERSLFFFCDDRQQSDFQDACFSSSAIITELSKPLQNKGRPKQSILFLLFKRIKDDQSLNIEDDILRGWIQVFAIAFFESTSNYSRYQHARSLYIDQLISRFDYVRFVGIALERDIEGLVELDKLFVLPSIGKEIKTSSAEVLEMDMPWFSEDGDLQRELIYKPRQLGYRKRSLQGTFNILDLLSHKQSNVSVLLGDPGSGKTLLMHYLSVMIARGKPKEIGLDPNVDWLPISIDIRDLLKIPNNNILNYIYKSAIEKTQIESFPDGFFEYWLEDGRAVILLDGLDEIVDEVARWRVVQDIYAFLHRFQKCRAIITSRVAGYRQDYFPSDSYPQYYLQPFNDDNIKEFIIKWYTIRSSTPKRQASKLIASLNNQINNSDRIKMLARNPLLLTIIALIHRAHTSLPRQRSKLYDRAIETLVGSWDAYKEIPKQDGGGTGTKRLQYLKPDDFRPLLEMTARWMHEQGGTGAIEERNLFEQISQDIQRIRGIKPREAIKEAERFVVFISDRTSLLTKQGKDRYAFVHKTFQEYLCAQSLLYQIHDELTLNVVSSLIERDQQHDQHWQEVILLLISQLKPKNASIAIRKILRKENIFSPFLHRNLIFSGRCLAENPLYLRQFNDECSQEVIDDLVKLEISDPTKIGYQVREQVAQTLCSMHDTEFESQAITSLRTYEQNIGRVRLQQYRAVLGERESAIDKLLQLVEDENPNIRAKSVLAISTLDLDGKHIKAAAKLMLKRLEDDSPSVRASAFEAVGNFGISNKMVQRVLKKGLVDPSFSVHTHATSALGKLGNSSDMSTSAPICRFLFSLLKDEDAKIRAGAASAIGRLGNISENEIQKLTELLRDRDLGVRYGTIYALGNLSHNSTSVTSLLEDLLESKDPGVYASAALALGRIGKLSKGTAEALLVFLREERLWLDAHPEWKIGNLAYIVKALLESVEVNSLPISKRREVLQVINNLFESEDEWWSVSQIIWALGSSPIKLSRSIGFSEQVSQKIFERLEHKNPTVRFNASYALRKLSQKNVDCAGQVMQWIQTNPNSEFVGYGVDVLWDCVQTGVLSPTHFSF